MFIVEAITSSGRICENYATYEEARRRVEQLPIESLLGIPFIFQELADGSQRLVRDDGKALQWHRLLDDSAAGPDEPIPLSEDAPPLLQGGIRLISMSPPDEEPLPLAEEPEPEKPQQ